MTSSLASFFSIIIFLHLTITKCCAEMRRASLGEKMEESYFYNSKVDFVVEDQKIGNKYSTSRILRVAPFQYCLEEENT